jgi:hypothetical protein
MDLALRLLATSQGGDSMNESQCEQRRETAVPDRRTFLKHSSLLIAGAAGAQLFLPSTASAQDARVAQDIAVLN